MSYKKYLFWFISAPAAFNMLHPATLEIIECEDCGVNWPAGSLVLEAREVKCINISAIKS